MKPVEKENLFRRVGNPSQLYSIRRVTLQEGPGKETNVFEVETAAGLAFDVLPDTGLDIGRLRYKGVNLSYISKNGYDSPARILPYENEFLHTFPAGMLYTCGLRNVGPACRDAGEWFPLHGRYHGIVADNTAACIEDDMIVIRGTIRETMLFGACLQLTRLIRIPLWGSEIFIEDTVENLTPKPEEFMLLYHFNFGWPMLSEKARLLLAEPRKTTPRTAFAETRLGCECAFEPPVDGEEEAVFFHELPETKVKLENWELGIAAELSWSGDTLPVLAQWRCMASGEYVLGLEPSNCFIMGREKERENGSLKILDPFQTKRYALCLKIHDIKR